VKASRYDVIVIGAGHNGLVAAAYLARAGKRVLVLERQAMVGGAAVTEEIHPGFRVSTVADGGGYLSARVAGDLGIATRVSFVSSEAVAFCPQPDGSQLTIWRDPARTAEAIARFSSADARRYPQFIELMDRIAEVMRAQMELTPPDLPAVGLRDVRAGSGLLAPVRRLGRKRVGELLRVLPMSAEDLLSEYFESPAVKAAIGASSVLNITWGPREAGTAFMMLGNWALGGTGAFRSASVVKGGMGALTSALAATARDFGADIRTGVPVNRVIVQQGRAVGVELEGGDTMLAAIVVSNAGPRTTFHELVEPRVLDASFVRSVGAIKFRGSAARIHLALSELPEFPAVDSDDAERLRAPIQIAPSLDYVQRAYDCTKYGRYSDHPYLDVLIPTLSDPTLAPDGRHVMSITAKYAPYELRDGTWDVERDAFADIVIDTLAEYAPGIRDMILHREILVPVDLEARFGLAEGNPNHGEMTLDQIFHMRPVPGYARYRTPVEGLYMCGAATHPGGGVTGLPGHNAAREILADVG
jgi:phytoene dehydrogenase-like protein